MLVAIISDIHGNLEALQEVLADAADADEVWCLGDVVGYGPKPAECVAAIREQCTVCLSGNHDLAAIGALNLNTFNLHAAAANAWTSSMLSDEDKRWLADLSSTLIQDHITIAHGTPRDPIWEYLLSSSIATASFGCFITRLCFVGHSHVPLIAREPLCKESSEIHSLNEERLTVGDGRLIANPGSVGQPRDGDPRASYLIYDTVAEILHHRRVPYDIETTQAQMRAHGLHAYLVDRLSHGM